MENLKINRNLLGCEVKSSVSGFTGIVTAHAIHMNGCDRCWLQPKVKKDGELPSGQWFDEPELVLLKKPKTEIKKRDTGGFPSAIK